MDRSGFACISFNSTTFSKILPHLDYVWDKKSRYFFFKDVKIYTIYFQYLQTSNNVLNNKTPPEVMGV